MLRNFLVGLTMLALVHPSQAQTAQQLFEQGQRQFQQQQVPQAIATLRQAQAKDPSLPGPYAGLGVMLNATQAYADALAVSTQGLARFANDPNLLLSKAQALNGLGRYPEAQATAQAALAAEPGTGVLAYGLLGTAYAGQGQHLKATESFSQAIAAAPDNPATYYDRGVSFLELGRPALALRDFNKALEMNPSSGMVYNKRGVAHYQQGQLAQAQADFEQALKLTAKFPEAQLNLGNVYAAQEQPAAALAAYGQALALSPRYGAALAGRGTLYYQQKNYPAALADFTQALAVEPRYSAHYAHRAMVYNATHRPAEALADASQALAINAVNNPEAYQEKGLALLLLDRPDDAITTLSAGIAALPNTASLYYLRSAAYTKKGQVAEAARDDAKAKELYTSSK